MLKGHGDSPQYALTFLNPSRIRQAREREGLSGKELAGKIGKSPSAVSQFESGVSKPDLSTLIRLSMALRVPTIYFAQTDDAGAQLAFDACHFRARRSVSQRTRRASIRMGEEMLSVVWHLRSRGVQFPDEQLSSFRDDWVGWAERTDEEIEQAASGLRKHFGLGFGPIPNLTTLLESKGVFVFVLSSAHEDVDAYSVWADTVPCVMLAHNKTAARARFDAAHELAHLVLHDETCQVGSKTIEQEANRFAGAFNAPREGFLAECPRRWNLEAFLRLRDRWKISVGALVRRAYDLGRLSEFSYKKANKELSARGLRRGEPGDAERPKEKPVMVEQAFQLLEGSITADELGRDLGTYPQRVIESLEPLLSAQTLERVATSPIQKSAEIVSLDEAREARAN